MWARVHKIDRIRPQPGGGAIVLVEDERSAAAMARVPSLSVVIAVARVLNARRVRGRERDAIDLRQVLCFKNYSHVSAQR